MIVVDWCPDKTPIHHDHADPVSLLLLGQLAWVAGLAVLLIGGLLGLRQTRPGHWHTMAAWAVVAAAGIGLGLLPISRIGQPAVPYPYRGPARIDWIYLPEAGGFALIGASAVWILVRAERQRLSSR